MILKCLQQHCEHEREYLLSKLDRFLLTLKAIVSICLRLEAIKEVDVYKDNYVLVAITDGGTYWTEWGRGGWYEGVMISLKWNEWRYIIHGDSSP